MFITLCVWRVMSDPRKTTRVTYLPVKCMWSRHLYRYPWNSKTVTLMNVSSPVAQKVGNFTTSVQPVRPKSSMWWPFRFFDRYEWNLKSLRHVFRKANNNQHASIYTCIIKYLVKTRMFTTADMWKIFYPVCFQCNTAMNCNNVRRF